MLTQREWVEGCYAYYAENGYDPGNPEDGEWEKAHYPVPRCEGGEDTILLLKEHHAVQGVLQSEEYRRPCIFGWEATYLEGEMLELYKKWKSESGRRGSMIQLASATPEQLSARSRKAWETMRRNGTAPTPEQLSEFGRRGKEAQMDSTTPEQRSARARKSWETRRRNGNAPTPEQLSEFGRRGRAAQLAKRQMPPDVGNPPPQG